MLCGFAWPLINTFYFCDSSFDYFKIDRSFSKYISLSQGDSGGGVVYKDKIYGVISFLGDPYNVCRTASAFMDLCNPKYAKWISKTIT